MKIHNISKALFDATEQARQISKIAYPDPANSHSIGEMTFISNGIIFPVIVNEYTDLVFTFKEDTDDDRDILILDNVKTENQ